MFIGFDLSEIPSSTLTSCSSVRVRLAVASSPSRRGDDVGLFELEAFIAHPSRLELASDLIVFDARIFLHLVVGQELLPGSGKIFVGRDRRHQRADIEPTRDYEVTTDRVEEERAELLNEIIDEFDNEFLAVDLVTLLKIVPRRSEKSASSRLEVS